MSADLEELRAALDRADADAFRVVALRLAQARFADVHEPLLQALQHHDPGIRAAAAAGVAHLDDPAAVDQLFQLLQDPEPGVREEAIAALIHLGPGLLTADLAAARPDTSGQRCLRDLVHLLRGEPADPYPIYDWPDASTRAIKLCIALLHHRDSAVRVRAADLLGATQDRRAVDELLHALTHDDPATRIAAAMALGEHGKTSRVVPLLVEAFHDPHPEVRTAVAFSLSRFDSLGGDIPGERMRPVVEHLLRHPDIEARRRVILMLGRSRGTEAVDLLLTAVNDRDASVRAEAIVALSRFREARIEPALRVALTDADEMVRLRAVDALERLGTPEPLPLALRDPSPLVRVQAIKALRWTGVEPVLPELLTALRDPAEAVRLEVVELVAGHPTPEVIAAVVDALPSESFPLIRQKMLAMIGRSGEAHDIFRRHLDDPASEVRAQAVQYLGEQADANLFDLLPRAADEAAEVRVALILALERIDTPLARLLVNALLHDPAPEVRDAAVWAMRGRSTEEALLRALPLLDDPAELVRLSVAVLLAALHVRGEFSFEQLRATYDNATSPSRLALLEICDGIRDRRLVPLLLSAIRTGEPEERARAMQVLTELKRGDPARRHPRVADELHRRAAAQTGAARPPVRVVEPQAGTGPAALDERMVFTLWAAPSPRGVMLLQLWACLPDQVEHLVNRPLDDSDYRIQSKFGPTGGARLGLSALLEGVESIDPEDDLYWDGTPAAARFLVRPPVGTVPLRITVYRDGLPIARVTSELAPSTTGRLPAAVTLIRTAVGAIGLPEARLIALRRVVPWLTVRRLAIGEPTPADVTVYTPPTPADIWAYLRGRVHPSRPN